MTSLEQKATSTFSIATFNLWCPAFVYTRDEFEDEAWLRRTIRIINALKSILKNPYVKNSKNIKQSSFLSDIYLFQEYWIANDEFVSSILQKYKK